METKTQGRLCRAAIFAGALAATLVMTESGPAQSYSTSGSGQSTTQSSQQGPQVTAQGRAKIGPNAPVTYDNRWEVYGGLSFMNFQGGQDLPTRMNLGGGEAMGTYWATPRLGVAADWRGEWGTTPVKPNTVFNGRALAGLNSFMGGVQYRGPKNQYAALDYHALVGAAYGKFDYTADPVVLGLYTNRTKPMAALGASVDFNYRRNIAFRVQPDLILEHFGTETREFFSISGGVVWRIGKR